MALVGYDFSDDSDSENEREPKNFENFSDSSKNKESFQQADLEIEEEQIDIVLSTRSRISPRSTDSSDDEDEPQKITFSNLPKPNYHVFNSDEVKLKNLKLPNLAKMMPAVRSRNNKNDPSCSQKLVLKKEHGLLSVLPKPENEAPFPNLQKLELPSKLIPTHARNASIIKPEQKTFRKTLVSKTNDDDDDIGTDFFALSKSRTDDVVPDNDLSLCDIEIDENASNNFPQPNVPLIVSRKSEETISGLIDNGPECSQNLSDLDEDLLQRIRGRKRKGVNFDNVQLIDINEAEILAESKKVSAKHFTDEVMCNPAPKASSSSTLSKRKHQITYLAFQAKERELELKSQWATNRATRKQTQSKYGF